MMKKVGDLLKEQGGKFSDLEYDTSALTLKEIKLIIKKFSMGKAPGPDNFTTDLLKDLDDEALEQLRELLNKWWTTGIIPDNVTIARVVSLYKKGDPDKQENYRPISLLDSFYKILAAGLQRRLQTL